MSKRSAYIIGIASYLAFALFVALTASGCVNSYQLGFN